MTQTELEQRSRLNGFAVASPILAILWFFGLGAILALVFGYTARRQILASDGAQSGYGIATVGIVLGWIGIVSTVLFTLLLAFGRAA